MKIYLDVCCLNRPFDDQSQFRIRMEADAIRLVFDLVARGEHSWVSSEVVEFELGRNPNADRRSSVQSLLRFAKERIPMTDETVAQASRFVDQGFAAVDALHLASAQAARCDILLTVDDRLLRRAAAVSPAPAIRVANPAVWVAEAAGQ